MDKKQNETRRDDGKTDAQETVSRGDAAMATSLLRLTQAGKINKSVLIAMFRDDIVERTY